MDTDTALRTRRTIKVYTGAPIDPALVEALITVAVLAPNHRLTQPWRFAALAGADVPALVALVRQPPIATAVEARKLAPITERLARCGALVQVTCLRSPDAETQREDLAATCAAVQNLLLAAHARGIASYWSTSPLMTHPATLRWFGADPEAEAHVATVWLGLAAEQPVQPPRRPLAEVLRWVRPGR